MSLPAGSDLALEGILPRVQRLWPELSQAGLLNAGHPGEKCLPVAINRNKHIPFCGMKTEWRYHGGWVPIINLLQVSCKVLFNYRILAA